MDIINPVPDGSVATLAALLDRQAAAAPEAIAFIDRDRPLRYGALARESAGLAAGLARLGVGAGDRVAIWLPNIPAWFAGFFACARLGAIAVAVNTRFKSGEVADIVQRSGAKILIYWPGFKGIDFNGIIGDVPAEALAAVSGLVLYHENEAALPARVHGVEAHDYHALAATPPMPGDEGGPEAGCVIFTTSGTTRAPKFVLHPQRSILAHAADVAAALALDAPDTVMMPAVPFCGVTGFCQAMAALAAGRPVIGTPAFEPAEAAGQIRRHAVTHTAMLGEMAANLIAAAPPGPRPFPSLRLVGFAAFSPTQLNVVPEAEALGIPLVGLYGSSEVQALFSRQPFHLPALERAQGGGIPMSSQARVRVRDAETGELLPPERSGELEFAGPSRMMEYFNNPEATRAALTEDGYFRSGDLGYLTGDGRFVYQSRMGDALRLAGFLVSPVEIEAFIKEHPAIADAQVVGVEIAGSPRAVAFVITVDGTEWSEEVLIAHCRARMANYKVPARILAIEEFPVTPSANGNKIQKARLRGMAQAALEAV